MATMKESELIVNRGGCIYHLGLTAHQVAPRIVLCGDPDRVDLIAGLFDPGTAGPAVQNREFRSITGLYKGRSVSTIGTGIGPDNTEIALVELYALNEFDPATRRKKPDAVPLTIIRVGTCGSPLAEAAPGTLAITDYAVGLDATALFYDGPAGPLDPTLLRLEKAALAAIESSVPPDARFRGAIRPNAAAAFPMVTEALKRSARSGWISGITLTAPGFFAPQGREIEGLTPTAPKLVESLAALEVDGLRVVNIEMETALLLHLAALMGYRAGSVCAVIANRATGRFLAEFQPAVKNATVAALDALIEIG